jgi:hypothetical protein
MKFLNTTKKRDAMRWILVVIAFSLMLFDFFIINQDYVKLYEFEISEMDRQNNDVIIESFDIINPSDKLNLSREITFKILNIVFYALFIITIWLRRFQMEELNS